VTSIKWHEVERRRWTAGRFRITLGNVIGQPYRLEVLDKSGDRWGYVGIGSYKSLSSAKQGARNHQSRTKQREGDDQ
jgi:hypothetical protein